jgi:hypothetical protein
MKQKVYLMRNAFGLHKIGISVNPRKRAMDISNNSGVTTELLHVWDSYNAFITEQRLHMMFTKKRKHGEWFKFTNSDVKSLHSCFWDVDSRIPVISIEPTLKTAWEPPCLDIKAHLFNYTTPTTDKEINLVIDMQHSLLNNYLKERGKSQLAKLMAELERDGLHIDYAWKFPIIQCGSLYSFGCGILMPRYPICSASQKDKMEHIILKERVILYQAAVDEARKELDMFEINTNFPNSLLDRDDVSL